MFTSFLLLLPCFLYFLSIWLVFSLFCFFSHSSTLHVSAVSHLLFVFSDFIYLSFLPKDFTTCQMTCFLFYVSFCYFSLNNCNFPWHQITISHFPFACLRAYWQVTIATDRHTHMLIITVWVWQQHTGRLSQTFKCQEKFPWQWPHFMKLPIS